MNFRKTFHLIFCSIIFCFGVAGSSYGKEKSIYVYVGKTKIAINVPQDYAEVKRNTSPGLWKIAKSWTPDTKELLAMIVEKGVIGSSAVPDTYLLVQAPKQNQSSVLSDDDFDQLKKALKQPEKSSEEKDKNKEDEPIKDPEKTRSGFLTSKRLQPGSFSLGVFHETLNSIGTADIIRQIIKVEGEKKPHFTVVATTVLFLREKLFYMYVFKEYESEPDADWAEIMSEHWVNTTITINHQNRTTTPTVKTIQPKVKKGKKVYKTDLNQKQIGDVTIYFKNGRSLVCEKVWREGNHVFVIGKGKKYAVSYSVNEIDLDRTFRNK